MRQFCCHTRVAVSLHIKAFVFKYGLYMRLYIIWTVTITTASAKKDTCIAISPVFKIPLNLLRGLYIDHDYNMYPFFGSYVANRNLNQQNRTVKLCTTSTLTHKRMCAYVPRSCWLLQLQ